MKGKVCWKNAPFGSLWDRFLCGETFEKRVLHQTFASNIWGRPVARSRKRRIACSLKKILSTFPSNLSLELLQILDCNLRLCLNESFMLQAYIKICIPKCVYRNASARQWTPIEWSDSIACRHASASEDSLQHSFSYRPKCPERKSIQCALLVWIPLNPVESRWISPNLFEYCWKLAVEGLVLIKIHDHDSPALCSLAVSRYRNGSTVAASKARTFAGLFLLPNKSLATSSRVSKQLNSSKSLHNESTVYAIYAVSHKN